MINTNYLWTAALPLCLLLVDQASAESFTPNDKVLYKTIGETELYLHVFTPADHKASDKRPVIVFFHGGSWKRGNPDQFFPHCHYLASRGMVAMSAEYRVSSKNGTSPRECVKDGKSAIRWIRQHANELGVDDNQIVVGGGSAGGHVAACTGTTSAFNEKDDDLSISCIPRALVLFNPVFDNGPDGYGYNRVKEYWRDISPLHNINDETPPTIVFLGDRDELIPVSTAEEYRRIMNDKGLRCDLHIYKDQLHGFFNYKYRDNYNKTVLEMDRFLKSLGFLNGSPTLEQ